MAGVSSGIVLDANMINLKEITQAQIKPDTINFLVPGESIIQCFQTVRDQVIFTNKRVFVINVQGITGKKTSYFSYPYSKVVSFGVETAGVLDIDSELLLTFMNGIRLQFDFVSNVDIKGICANISNCILTN